MEAAVITGLVAVLLGVLSRVPGLTAAARLAAVSGLLGVPMVRFFGGQDNLRPLGVAADRRAFRHCAPEGIRTPNLLIRR